MQNQDIWCTYHRPTTPGLALRSLCSLIGANGGPQEQSPEANEAFLQYEALYEALIQEFLDKEGVRITPILLLMETPGGYGVML
jgi:hypothetical protein